MALRNPELHARNDERQTTVEDWNTKHQRHWFDILHIMHFTNRYEWMNELPARINFVYIADTLSLKTVSKYTSELENLKQQTSQ